MIRVISLIFYWANCRNQNLQNFRIQNSVNPLILQILIQTDKKAPDKSEALCFMLSALSLFLIKILKILTNKLRVSAQFFFNTQ